MSDTNDKIRIVQETVAGKEITFAHVIGGPAPIIYQKLGLNPAIDYGAAAIGIMNMTPPESAVIAADIAVKSGGLCRPLYRHGHHHGRAGGRHLCPDGDCKLLPR